MSRILGWGKRQVGRLLSRRIRVAVGAVFEIVGAVGSGLAAIGVTGPLSLPWVWASAVAVGTVLLLSVIRSYQTELQAHLAPTLLAEEVNDLRGRLRDLLVDAYKGPTQMPRATWEQACITLLGDCKTLIASQRNKYTIPLRDAIQGHHVKPLKVMKDDRQTMDMLNRVDRVLGLLVDEIAYP